MSEHLFNPELVEEQVSYYPCGEAYRIVYDLRQSIDFAELKPAPVHYMAARQLINELKAQLSKLHKEIIQLREDAELRVPEKAVTHG